MTILNCETNYSNILNVKHDNLEALIKSIDKPVIVDLWAPWCGPCRQMNPIINEIAEDLGEKVQILKVNIDENKETAKQYGILSIPTILILDPAGKVISRQVGVSSDLQNSILEILDPYISH